MTGVLNISVTPKRMLTKAEAAHYCSRPASRFARECPVSPVEFANGDMRYDMRDLDKWLDGMKCETGASLESIVARLG